MSRKASGEIYIWDNAKEKKFLEKMDQFLSYSGDKHHFIQILEQWATQFNSEYGGVPTYGLTLYQGKKKREDKENI